MKRNMILIDEDKCNGCGLCISACHEGALQLIDGKARLVSDIYCDGLGACLPACPTGAMQIVEREAAPFDEEAVAERMKHHAAVHPQTVIPPLGCPGMQARVFDKPQSAAQPVQPTAAQSELRQWPCQLRLVPVHAPYFDNAHLLIAADCTAFAYANIHQDFIKNKITLIGCPKLDDADYSEKLTQILAAHSIKSLTVLRMEVPCCGGLEHAAKQALINSGQMIPWRVVTISTDGRILED
ncbi:4Fe-4S binding protein [Anaerospora hongkongensis]|uniref:4Fe-4S binding protein n=1 Tax=Anaerospora hongkongensis TaxID=244830 RepID=A0A4R1PU36_9FIRM|nr:4Fe-4S binding protein [Anaerospora hongkongensis]TCL33607.1 4Fe-4S binding protein [Anaerospora hongkongensis]